MNMFDEARSLLGMMDMRRMSQAEAARMLGVSQSYVANKLRLLKLDKSIADKISASALTERHARTLLRLNDKDKQMEALDIIIERSLTVAEAEALIDLLREAEAPRTLGSAPALKQLDAFITRLDDSVKALNSKGLKTVKSTSYYGKKMYITICIEEN